MTEVVFNEKGKPIGQIKNGNLFWTCSEGFCTWTNPAAKYPISGSEPLRTERIKLLESLQTGIQIVENIRPENFKKKKTQRDPYNNSLSQSFGGLN